MDGSGRQCYRRHSKWSDRGTRTVIPNVAHILPPDLPPDVLQIFLLRFQLEEVEYKLSKLEEEFVAVSSSDVSVVTGRGLPDVVQARHALVQERQQIVASIERVFPVFRPPMSVRSSRRQVFRKIGLPSQSAITSVMGPKGTLVRDMEREFNVKISFRSVPDWELEGDDDMLTVFVVGACDNDVDQCERRILKAIEATRDVDDGLEMKLSFVPVANDRPWMSAMIHEVEDDVAGALDDLMREINDGVADADDESHERHELLSRFAVDLGMRDVSSVILEPTPLGV